MGKVLHYSVENKSKQSLFIQFWGGKDTQNEKGDITGVIKPGQIKSAEIEKNAKLFGAAAFDGVLKFMVYMTEDVTYQEGPEEVTLPKKKVGEMEFLARPMENWGRGYSVFSLPAHYPIWHFTCSMEDNVAKWVITN